MGFRIAEVGDEFVLMRRYDPSYRQRGDLIRMLPEWVRNALTNIETASIDYTITDLDPIDGSVMIVDHPFTGSFERQAEHLKNFDGTIMCCDRALYKCLEYDVVPDYVLNVDSSYLVYGFIDRADVRAEMKDITAIFAITTNPITVRMWSGKRVFFVPSFGMQNLNEALSASAKLDIVAPGGCVHNTAFSIAWALGSKSVVLYGIDNSYETIGQAELPKEKHDVVRVSELNKSFLVDNDYRIYAETMFYWMDEITKMDGDKSTVFINVGESGIMYESVARKWGYNRVKIQRKTLSEVATEIK